MQCLPEGHDARCDQAGALCFCDWLPCLPSDVDKMAVQGATQLTTATLYGLLQALTAALLMNVCIVGINQIYDVEIDKINKPYLPLACGDLSMNAAVWIVSTTGAASLALGIASASAPLFATLALSLLLGIAYSTDLPLLRWKRYPIMAAGCILAVRWGASAGC